MGAATFHYITENGHTEKPWSRVWRFYFGRYSQTEVWQYKYGRQQLENSGQLNVPVALTQGEEPSFWIGQGVGWENAVQRV